MQVGKKLDMLKKFEKLQEEDDRKKGPDKMKNLWEAMDEMNATDKDGSQM